MNRAPLAILLTAALAACTAAPDAGSADPSSQVAGMPAASERDEPYAPEIDPATFVEAVDNPYFPLAPGTLWVYEGSGDAEGETDTVEVLTETRTVMGVVCTAVRDVVSMDGEPVEVTEDWYAQDADGNVWYFGEETAEYENGEVVSTAGAWEAGVDGAQPGIIMPAEPQVGVTYRQEFYAGEAEDMAKAVEIGASATVPQGSFTDVLVTEDWTPLEPEVAERKSYAPGLGLVREEQVRGGDAGFALVEFNQP
jgi:hypothetical protein